MTAGISVERVIERDFRFPCPCGATIKLHGKTATCTACGKTIEVRRVRKHQNHWNLVPPRWGTPSVRVADLATLAIFIALCVLFLAWLYDLLVSYLEVDSSAQAVTLRELVRQATKL